MANKKYSEFPAGTFDPAKIILQADPTTGALTKILLSAIASKLFGLTDNLATTNRVFEVASHNFAINNSNGGLIASLGILSFSGTPAAVLSSQDGAGIQSQVGATPDGISLGSYNTTNGNNTYINLSPDEIDIQVADGATNESSSINMTPGVLTAQQSTDTNTVGMTLRAGTLSFGGLPSFATNAAAIAGGLTQTEVYNQNGLLAIVI